MTYATELPKSGRKPIRLVEIDFEKCALVNGVGVCTADRTITGTALAGSNNTITLDGSASGSDDTYNGQVVFLSGGTGSGLGTDSERIITDYDGATKVATVSVDWTTNPDATSDYTIINRPDACFNTRKTCNDLANYDGTAIQTITLSELTAEHQFDMGAIPCVDKISTAHTRIDPGQATVGKVAGLTLECVNFNRAHDRDVDPYFVTRTYTPENQGTYFGKLKARHPYYQDAEVRIKTGYLSTAFDAANFKTRTYFLEKFEGPDKAGRVRFVAQGITRRIDDKRLTVPEITTGTLNSSLSAGETTSFIVTGDEDKYDTTDGSVRINEEIIEYTTGVDNMDGTFTFSTLTRGVDNTTAAAHAAGDTAQACELFNAQTGRQIAYTLWITKGGLAASYVDDTAWDAVADIWLQKTYTRRITEPTGISQLLGEIHQQASFFTFWDEENAEIKLEAIRPPSYLNISTYNQTDSIIDGSIDITESSERRITRVYVHYNPRRSIEGGEPNHFQNEYRLIDKNAESAFGDARILTIFARWITATSNATSVAGRILNRFQENEQTIKFSLDAKDEDLNTGDHAYINADAIEDETGLAKDTLIQIMQRDETKVGSIYTYRAQRSNYAGRYGFIAPNGKSDYSAEDEDDLLKYAWIGEPSGANFNDGKQPYKII